MRAHTPPSLPALLDVSDDVLSRARNIRILGLDVDGVMTNGEIIYTEQGDELKIFNAKDGLGLRLAVKAGLRVTIITGRRSALVERRGQELGIAPIFQGVRDKRLQMQALLDETDFDWSNVCYVGDDLPDLGVMQASGLACCPSDAVSDVQRICHWVAPLPGGRGAIRTITDLILYAQGISPHALLEQPGDNRQ
jgi:3-deoxy-D-manno-octulosonate 8-phosphate phosphatase (KDO 8-P phosphatase)